MSGQQWDAARRCAGVTRAVGVRGKMFQLGWVEPPLPARLSPLSSAFLPAELSAQHAAHRHRGGAAAAAAALAVANAMLSLG